MKLILTGIVGLVLILFIVPALVVYMPWSGVTSRLGTQTIGKSEGLTIRLYRADERKIVELSLEDYVKGVVAAEMPADFEPAALAAQAIAARTYAVRSLDRFGGTGCTAHPGADVSSDFHEGQAWLADEKLKAKWGDHYRSYSEKIEQAVALTRGLILTYQGEPIHAVFHSTSGPRTASAKEVWGFDYPYLVSVPVRWEEDSPRYQEEKEYLFTGLEKQLGGEIGVMSAMQNGKAAAVQIMARTESGRVERIRLGSKQFSGQELREKLGLKSTNFTVEVKADRIIFHTVGYGHGVGLSQYGANGMAKAGFDYQKIINYFYHGVELTNLYGA